MNIKSQFLKVEKYIIVILVFVCGFLMNRTVIYAEGTKQPIKVGYIDYAGFIEKNNDGTMEGYAVSYLNEIGKYTNWKYEYRYDTWDKCLEALKKGEIDLLCSAQYTSERGKDFDFAKYSSGVESSVLYVREDNEDIYYNDFQALDGKTVGLLNGSYQNDALAQFANDNSFTYKTKYYDTETKLIEGLKENEIDVIAAGSLALHRDLKIVGKFGSDPFYFITKKGNKELLGKLNDALEEIKSRTPYFEYGLHLQFYQNDNASNQPLFTREEIEYIKKRGKIKIGISSRNFPLSSYQNKEGFKGIYIDLLSELAKQSGLKFELIETDDKVEVEKLLEKKEFELIAGIVRSEQYLENNAIQLTREFFNGEAVAVAHSGKKVDLSKPLKVAIRVCDRNLEQYFKAKRPHFTVIKKDTIEECLTAVANHEVDITTHDSYRLNYYLQNPRYEKLTTLQSMDISEPVCIVGRADMEPLLLSVINKTIESLPADRVRQIVSDNSVATTYEPSFRELLYKFRTPIQYLFILVLICMVLGTIAIKKRVQAIIAQKENDVLRDRAERDDLTGLYNRDTFYAKAHQLMGKQSLESFKIMTVDIERFKVVNELYGCTEGDKLLKYIAQCLEDCVYSQSCVIGRIGGDNFAICIDQSQGFLGDIFEITVNRLKQYPLEVKIFLRGGIYPVEDTSMPVNIMCDRANLASESVKGSHINKIGIYNDEHRKRLIIEQDILNDMHDAIKNREFEVFIQPKFRLKDEILLGGEALVRWIHPKKGLIPPSDFIPVFEQNGFIVQLDYYVWEETCKILKQWKYVKRKMVPLSVNVSRMNFYNPHLCEKLINLVNLYGLDPRDLELEITESAYTESAYQLTNALLKLQTAGFRILMDDFGSGYSSLNMLKDVPVDVLKLDLCFLQSSSHARRGEDIVSAIISMARKLCMPVIAEGVETEEQVEFLRSVKCYSAQGYYYAKPLPLEEFDKLIDQPKYISR